MNFQRQEQLPVAAFCFVFLRVFDGKLLCIKFAVNVRKKSYLVNLVRIKHKKMVTNSIVEFVARIIVESIGLKYQNMEKVGVSLIKIKY
jgi:hypothetical protein